MFVIFKYLLFDRMVVGSLHPILYFKLNIYFRYLQNINLSEREHLAIIHEPAEYDGRSA